MIKSEINYCLRTVPKIITNIQGNRDDKKKKKNKDRKGWPCWGGENVIIF